MSNIEKTANEAVKFVWNAFCDPATTLSREGIGELHAILIPYLREYSAHPERQMAFVSAVGSVNYGCSTPDSDVDLKAAYLPSFDDLYFRKENKFSFVTDRFDCELHPMQRFRYHALKGNMNFFEPLLSNLCVVGDNIKPAWKALQRLVRMNVKETALATFFTAESMNKGTLYVAPPFKSWNYKNASHALRLLTFLVTLLDQGEFELRLRGPIKDMILSLKKGETRYDVYQALYAEMHNVVLNMTFNEFKHGGDYVFTDRVLDLDKRSTPEWKELNEEVDRIIMGAIQQCQSFSRS